MAATTEDGGDDGGWSRQDYLAWHKRLGLASAVVLTAQLAVGDALLKGLGDGEDVAGTRTAHRILGTSGFLLHAGSFGLDVAGEAKAKEGEPHHSGSVHRIAMIVSTLGIIATPILGIMLANGKFDDRDTGVLAHRVTAIVTVSGMWTAVITDWMD